MERRDFGVYGVRANGVVVYIGSSYKSLEELEYNHRNWRTKFKEKGWTYFREQLEKLGDQADFGWIIPPQLRTQKEIETLEGELIRKHNPMYNIDKDPVGSSIKHGRYK